VMSIAVSEARYTAGTPLVLCRSNIELRTLSWGYAA
jgi:hypothetical protein